MKFRFINIIVATFLIVSTSAFSMPVARNLNTSIIKIVVDKSGRGNFTSIKDAINSLPDSAAKLRVNIILLKKNRD
ncbi:MAG: hypothetical protein ABI358_06220 [Ginsengibacter sp.]